MPSRDDQPVEAFQLESVLPGEWPRLVRLCAHFSGDHDAAEDLAQETMLEGWRHSDRLRDWQGYSSWLAAIARNVSLRWVRQHAREQSHVFASIDSSRDTAVRLGELPADQDDITLDLEYDELAELLDRALALLLPETRRVLVEKYVEELPLGAIAERLHRGRLALRRVLATDLREEAARYGLGATEHNDWQETRIWCPICGRNRLIGRLWWMARR